MEEENSLSPQAAREFTEALLRAGLGAKEAEAALKSLTKISKEHATAAAKLSAWEKKSADEKKKDAEAQISVLKELRKQLKDRVISEDEFNEKSQEVIYELKRMSKGLDATTREAAKAAIQDVKNVELHKQAVQDFAKSAAISAATMVKAMFSATTGILKAVQGSSSGIQLASSAMTEGLEVFNQGATAATGMMTSAGAAMTNSTNAKVKIAGVALQGLGVVAKATADTFTAVEKARIELLTKEAEKVVNSYNSLAASGAMFVDGMDGMRAAAKDTGLGLDTLTNIQKNNASTLSAAGLSAAGGFKILTKTFKDAGPQFKDSLLNLGFTFEEQGELVAKTMEQMRRAGRDMSTVSSSDIANSTKEYATNLRTIAAITGQDAKRLAEEAKKASTRLAVRAKIQSAVRGGDKDAEARFEKAFQIAAAQGLENAFMQEYATSDKQGKGGIVTDAATNVIYANNPSLKGNMSSLTEIAKNRNMSANEAASSLAAESGKINEKVLSDSFAKSLEAIGVAGLFGAGSPIVSSVNALSESMLTKSQQGAKDENTAVAAATEVASSMITMSALQREMNQIQRAGEEQKASMEKSLYENLPQFAADMQKALDITQNMLNGLGNKIGSDGGLMNSLLSGLGGLADTAILVSSVLTGLSALFPTTMSGIAASLSGAITGIGTTIASAGSSIAATISGVTASVSSAGSTLAAGASAIGAGTIAAAAGAVVGVTAAAQAGWDVYKGGRGDNYVNDLFEAAFGPISEWKWLNKDNEPTLPEKQYVSARDKSPEVTAPKTSAPKLQQATTKDMSPATSTSTSTVSSQLIERTQTTKSETTNNVNDTNNKDYEAQQKIDNSMLSELRRISSNITESIKTATLTLEAQQKLVDLASDQIRALEKLTRHVA